MHNSRIYKVTDGAYFVVDNYSFNQTIVSYDAKIASQFLVSSSDDERKIISEAIKETEEEIEQEKE